MTLVVKIYSDFQPDSGRSKTWWLKFDDGSIAATIDSASGRDRFRLVDMLKLYQDRLSPALLLKLKKMTTK
jgi:hypothetical protein